MDTRLNLDTATFSDILQVAFRLGFSIQPAYIDNQPVYLLAAPTPSEWRTQANNRLVALQKRSGVY